MQSIFMKFKVYLKGHKFVHLLSEKPYIFKNEKKHKKCEIQHFQIFSVSIFKKDKKSIWIRFHVNNIDRSSLGDQKSDQIIIKLEPFQTQ